MYFHHPVLFSLGLDITAACKMGSFKTSQPVAMRKFRFLNALTFCLVGVT